MQAVISVARAAGYNAKPMGKRIRAVKSAKRAICMIPGEALWSLRYVPEPRKIAQAVIVRCWKLFRNMLTDKLERCVISRL